MRLDRARKHFAELEAACDRFVRDDPDTASGVELDTNFDTGNCILTAHIPREFPLEMGGLVGEILYHVRSSLDNLAWELVRANGGVPGKHTEFPVFQDEAAFKDRAGRMTRGMSKSARGAICDLQPFNEWPEYPAHTTLWKLHDLNNIDKHRLPHMASLWLARVQGGFRHEGDSGAHLVSSARRGALKNGAVLFHIRWDPALMRALPETQVQVDFDVSLDVAISNPEITFMEQGGDAGGAMPVRHLCQVAFEYMDTWVLPAFEHLL
jgi:hypothetical protein